MGTPTEATLLDEINSVKGLFMRQLDQVGWSAVQPLEELEIGSRQHQGTILAEVVVNAFIISESFRQ